MSSEAERSRLRLVVGVLAVVVGVVLLAAYRDVEFGFVRGLYLGLLVLVLGVVDVVSGLRNRVGE